MEGWKPKTPEVNNPEKAAAIIAENIRKLKEGHSITPKTAEGTQATGSREIVRDDAQLAAEIIARNRTRYHGEGKREGM